MKEQEKKTKLLCQSEKGNVRSVCLSLVVTALIVLTFQGIVFLNHIYNLIQIAILSAFLILLIYHLAKIKKDSKNWIDLYDNYFETMDGQIPYTKILSCIVLKGQVILKTDKKKVFYVKNAEELEQIIKRQMRKEPDSV